MKAHRKRTQREPTIALINVVFLMLVFFLIAGTVAPSFSPDLTLIDTKNLSSTSPPMGMVVHADGRLQANGEDIATPEAYLATLPEADRANIRLIPDRALPAEELLKIGAALRIAGADKVVIATEKARE